MKPGFASHSPDAAQDAHRSSRSLHHGGSAEASSEDEASSSDVPDTPAVSEYPTSAPSRETPVLENVLWATKPAPTREADAGEA